MIDSFHMIQTGYQYLCNCCCCCCCLLTFVNINRTSLPPCNSHSLTWIFMQDCTKSHKDIYNWYVVFWCRLSPFPSGEDSISMYLWLFLKSWTSQFISECKSHSRTAQSGIYKTRSKNLVLKGLNNVGGGIILSFTGSDKL